MGSVQDRRSNGRGWIAHWRDPDGKQRTKSFEKKRDAENYLTTVEGAKLTGDYIDPTGGKERLGERYERWMATTVNLRPSTRARDQSYARSMILPTFENMRLRDIDHDEVQAWVAKLIADGKAPATVQRAHQILGKVMRSAVRARLIGSNPCDETELPKIEQDEQRFLDPSEVVALGDAIDKRYRALVFVGAYCGLRSGEMFALRRRNVDLVRRTITVAETVVEVKGIHHFGPPKTRAGRRSVPLPRVVADELVDLLADLEPDDLVLTAPAGGPIRASLFRRRIWYPATVATGMGTITKKGKTEHYEGLRPHDLRHTAVAFWIEAGASPLEIARRAGHTSVSVVLDRYGHLLPRDTDEVTDALDAMATEGVRKAKEKAERDEHGADVIPMHRSQ